MYGLYLFFVSALVSLGTVSGHGMMLDPPNRSSLWRFDKTAPINYDDNENFCGGFGVQWGLYDGKCGSCGDSYGEQIPRSNENSGKYGLGKVVAEYKSGDLVNVSILLTANHQGWFSFSLCVLDHIDQIETEDCFQPLLFADGFTNYRIYPDMFEIYNIIKLPENLSCERCVLRWHYKAGNNWGTCSDGKGALGCGPQETFRSCSDISIV